MSLNNALEIFINNGLDFLSYNKEDVNEVLETLKLLKRSAFFIRVFSYNAYRIYYHKIDIHNNITFHKFETLYYFYMTENNFTDITLDLDDDDDTFEESKDYLHSYGIDISYLLELIEENYDSIYNENVTNIVEEYNNARNIFAVSTLFNNKK